MIKTVVFDIGNVIWRFRPAFDGVFRAWLKHWGISLHHFRLNYYEKDGYYRNFEKDTKNIADWFRQIAPDVDPKLFFKIMETKFGDPKYFTRYLKPEVIDVISKVRQTGLPVGCLTNTENFFYPYMAKNLLPYFDYHILSWQVGARKPDPKIYREIFKHGKFLPSEILFIDDVPINVAAAQKQGINAVLFTDVAKLKQDLKNFKII